MVERHFQVRTPFGEIRGMCHVPSGDPRGAVHLVHGYFSANRVGPARLYVDIARRLAGRGFVVYRADVLGVGDSDGAYSDVTLATSIRDQREVGKLLREEWPGRALVLVGHSMGANLCVRLADDATRKLILLAPEVRLRGGVDRLFSDAQRHQLQVQGHTVRKGLHINGSFIAEIRACALTQQVSELDCPVLVVHGDCDELYDKSGSCELASGARNGRATIVEGADHNFLEPAARARLLALLDDAVEVLESP